MAGPIQLYFDAWPAATPDSGASLGELTQAYRKSIQDVLSDTGFGRFTINRHDSQAAWCETGNLIRVRTVAGGPFAWNSSNYKFAFYIEDGDDAPVSPDEDAGDEWQRGGRGILSVLHWLLWWKTNVMGDPGVRADGKWHWNNDQFGDIFKRSIQEWNARPSPKPIPATLTYDFTSSDDTDSNPWPSFDGAFTIDVGTDYLDGAMLLVAQGIEIGMTPAYLTHAWIDGGKGSDKTATVAFRKGWNIREGGSRKIYAPHRATRALVKGTGEGDAMFVEVTDGLTSTDETGKWGRREAFVTYERSPDPAPLTRAGEQALAKLRVLDIGPVTIGVTSYGSGTDGGSPPAKQDFLPYTDYETGDLVTLDIPGEYTNEEKRIVEITISDGDNGEAEVSLTLGGEPFDPSTAAAQAHSTPGGTGCGCNVPHPPPACETGTAVYEPDLSTDTCWPGNWATTDGDPLLQAFLPAKWKTGSGGTSFDCSHSFLDGVLTPGASYRLEITFADKYFRAGPYNYIFRWKDAAEVELGSFTLVLSNIPGGFAPTTYGVDFVVPAGGYDHVHGSFPTFGPGLYKNVNITSESDSDPFCHDPDQSGDPDDPYYARPTHTHSDKYAALVHQHPRVTERLLNNSGATVNKGDIVVADQSMDGAFTTTTTASFTDGPVWVVEDESIADDASGLVLISGLATFVNLGGAAPTRGDFLFTATTAKRASTAGARAAGAFGQVLVNEADADGEPGAVIWGVPDSSSGGGGAPDDATYLVGAAHAGLSAEIVVGATPGGELGGTWASPTVDGTHSGSPHHAEDHAGEHAAGGFDELEVEGLATAETDTSKILAADGSGGLTFVGIGDVPSGDLVQIGSGEGSVRIPGLEAHFGKVGLGGGGIEEEYNTTTEGLTWAPSAPATHDSDTSVGSHLYITNSDTTERLGLRAFAPAGDFDVRMHLSTGRDSGASNADMGVIVTNSGNTVRAMTQIQIPSGAAGQANIQGWTYSGSYTQRGSTIVGAGWGGAVVLRLQYASGAIVFSFSHDGHTWYRIAALGFAITVANVGVRMSCGASTVLTGISDFLRTDV